MAFLIGLATVPAGLGTYLLVDVILPDRPCKEGFLGCLGEALLLLLAGCVLAGVLAQLSSRSLAGWVWMLGGLVVGITAVTFYSTGGVQLERTVMEVVPQAALVASVPATVAYFITTGLRWAAAGGAPGQSRDEGPAVPLAGRYWDGTRWVGTQP